MVDASLTGAPGAAEYAAFIAQKLQYTKDEQQAVEASLRELQPHLWPLALQRLTREVPSNAVTGQDYDAVGEETTGRFRINSHCPDGLERQGNSAQTSAPCLPLTARLLDELMAAQEKSSPSVDAPATPTTMLASPMTTPMTTPMSSHVLPAEQQCEGEPVGGSPARGTHLEFSLEDEDEAEEGNDWIGGLEAVGVGKCHMCGEKLPLDVESIERHDQMCWQRSSLDPAVHDMSRQASCKDCHALFPMDISAIEAHSRCCPARLPTVDSMRSARRRRPLVGWFGLRPPPV